MKKMKMCMQISEKCPSTYVVLFRGVWKTVIFNLVNMIEFELEILLTIVTQTSHVDGELFKFTTAGHFFHWMAA